MSPGSDAGAPRDAVGADGTTGGGDDARGGDDATVQLDVAPADTREPVPDVTAPLDAPVMIDVARRDTSPTLDVQLLDAPRADTAVRPDTSPGVDAPVPPTETGAGGPTLTLDAPHTRSEVCAVWAAYPHDQRTIPTLTGTDVLNCRAGDMPASFRANVLAQVNAYRYFSGLPPVTFEAVRNAKAQQCSLVEGRLGGLTHNIPTTAPCYTPEAAEAASNSNIAPEMADDSVYSYLVDWGPSNMAALGHRRWVLNTTTGPFGVGSTSQASCMWVLGAPHDVTREVVAFPGPGFFPYDAYFRRDWDPDTNQHIPREDTMNLSTTGWSMHSDTVGYFTGASVTVREGATVRPVTLRTLTGNYGSRAAIAWVPMGWQIERNHTYRVEVRTATRTITYDTQFVTCP